MNEGEPSATEKAKRRHHRQPPRPRQKLIAPNKKDSANLPAFPLLELKQISLPQSASACQDAVAQILAAGCAGFDTESRPTFRKGEKSQGPHLVQFSLGDQAFLFQLQFPACVKAVTALISSAELLKVGFGLKNDKNQIHHRLGITLKHVLDLDRVFKKIGYQGQIGVRGAIAVQFKQSFMKSKTTTMSDWSSEQLTDKQIIYAANDAYAALMVMQSLQDSHPEFIQPSKD